MIELSARGRKSKSPWINWTAVALCTVITTGYSPASGQSGEITRCGIGIDRSGPDGPINHLTVRLTEIKGLYDIPVGNPTDMAAWSAEIISQAKDQEGEGGDVEIEMRDVSIDYGFEGSFDHALIKALHGYSWDPGSCGRPSDNPNVGNASISLTQKMLKGSYSGAQYLCDGRRPIKKGSVSGSFECALPVLHDPAFEPQVPESQGYRTQAEAIWLYGGADNDFEALQRAVPLLQATSRTKQRDVSTEQEPSCDCSCPNLLSYDFSHPCHLECGPESRFEECKEENQDADAEDVCTRWEEAKAGEGVSPVVAQMIATIAQGMDQDCADMSPEEKASLEHMLNMMKGQ